MVTLASRFSNQIFEEIDLPYWLVNPKNLAIIHVNEAAQKLYGYSYDEFTQLKIPQLDYYDDQEIVEERAQRILQHGKETFETKHKTRDGTILDVVVHVKFHTIDGTPFLSVLTYDATRDHSLATQFKALFENVRDGILIVNIDNLAVQYANHTMLNLLGYSRDQVTTLKLDEIVHEESMHLLDDIRLNSPLCLPKLKISNAKGKDLFVEADISLPYVLEDQKCVALFVKDLTEKEILTNRLNDVTTAYRSLFDQLPEAAWLLDPSTMSFTDANKSALKLYEYTKEEFLKLKISDFDPFVTDETLQRDFKTIIDEGKHSVQTRHITKSGRELHVILSMKRVTLAGQNYISIICSDITEKKHQDELFILKMRQAQMGELMNMIAHQWRQPLSIINTLAQKILINMTLHRPIGDVFKVVKDIEEQTGYLSQTITDFKNMFQPKREKEMFQSMKIVEMVNSIIKDTLAAEDIALHSDIPDFPIHSYKHELVQVIIALIDNSINAFKDLQIEDKFISICAKEEPEQIIFEVKDNAGGIKNISLKDIFLPYASSKKELNGRGIGLYMAHSIIINHCKGDIGVTNLDEGTQFTITIPKN